MKVLNLTDADVFAGTERLIFELCCGLRCLSVAPVIGCPVPSPLAEFAQQSSIPIMKVGTTGVPKGVFADFRTVRRLSALLSNSTLDLIHVHNGRSALIAAISGAGRKVPLVMSQHFLAPTRTSRRGISGLASRFVHHWLNKRITRHIAISQAVREASIVSRVAPETKVSVVLNGIRRPEAHSVDSVWQKESWAKSLVGGGYVFCAARAEPEKDLPTLVRAIGYVRQKTPEVQCVVAGGGRELESVRGLAHSLRLGEHFRLIGFRKDVSQLMSDCSMLVLPALAEPFGLVILEAMALGKPVIACDAGGPREIVEHGVTGMLIPPGNHQAMGDAIALLLNAPKLRQMMGAAGEARYRSRFTAETMSQNMKSIYEEVLRDWTRK